MAVTTADATDADATGGDANRHVPAWRSSP
jgi:hypothetical protein